jgi:hypothetical protein
MKTTNNQYARILTTMYQIWGIPHGDTKIRCKSPDIGSQ